MTKHLLSMILGVAMGVLGLTILVDTALADGGCCCGGSCPNQTTTLATKACDASVQYTCEGQSDRGGCLATSVQFYEVKQDFPQCYVSVNARMKVNNPLRPCKRKTKCVWSDDNKCGVDPDSQEPWENATKYESEWC